MGFEIRRKVTRQRGQVRLRILLSIAAILLLGFTMLAFIQGNNVSSEESVAFREALSASNDLQIDRGEYLALAGNCASCHTTGTAMAAPRCY